MKKYAYKFILLVCIVAIAIYSYSIYIKNTTDYGKKVVLCIPVYGQSYALGEEAVRITNFDSLRTQYNGRIVNEHLDYIFGYYDHSSRFKQYIKRLLHYDKKAFELSLYGMAETLASKLDEDTIICIFPGGVGMAPIHRLTYETAPNKKFIQEIAYAYENAQKRGWEFNIPAICWMQGESDIVNYPGTDYKTILIQMHLNFNKAIKEITHQENDVRMICYQTNVITKGSEFKQNNYYAKETLAPESQMELIRDDTLFWASCPVYPLSFVKEDLHIDAVSQKRVGHYAALSILKLLRHGKHFTGVIPTQTSVNGNDIHISFNVPCAPLCFDTINVKKAQHYGFSVIQKDNTNIVDTVYLVQDTIIIKCKKSPVGCRIRYAINGESRKSGWRIGPRGNLRDSQGDNYKIRIQDKDYPQHNWCYMFDYICQ